ncbi:MAG: ABC transporter permease [Acidimicrobiales bacterium]
MTAFIVRRLGQAIIVSLIVAVVLFLLLHALPGGLVRAQLGPRASIFSVHQLQRQEGLLKPLPLQFLIWLRNVLEGNLGYSYKLNQTVGSLLAEYLPRTLLLVGSAILLAVAIAIPLGLVQAKRRNRVDDHMVTGVMLTFYSMPSFLLGVVLIVVLNLWLGALPSTASNFGSGLGTDFTDLVLPVMTLCLGSVSYFSRYTRSAAIDSLLEDYVKTARAKGASPWHVMLRHVLRNSLTSTVTMVGLSLPFVISGSLIVEELFNFPGIGLLFWNASQDRDYPVLLGVVLVVTMATVVGNLLADLGYAALDPRIRYT